jgi:hypothetical protein
MGKVFMKHSPCTIVTYHGSLEREINYNYNYIFRKFKDHSNYSFNQIMNTNAIQSSLM